MKNIDEFGGYPLLPEGDWDLEIFEVEKQKTKNNDPMALVKLRPTNFTHKEFQIWDRIVFPLPGSTAIKILGRSKHFLRCLGEPFDGEDLDVIPDRWMMRKVRASIVHKEYVDKNNKSRMRAEVLTYLLPEETAWDEEGQNQEQSTPDL